MGKVELTFNQIKDDLFSPGDIYWRKKSGQEVLISSKADILNIEMLRKLSETNNSILIENSTDYVGQKRFTDAFDEYKAEILISKKNQWRVAFNTLLFKEYYNTETPQFDLNLLCWKLFSTITREQGEVFITRDREYFLRTVSVASSYTLCAYLLGYYDVNYLISIFNLTILSQMEIGKDKTMNDLKNNLENLRRKPSLEEDDKNFIKELIDIENFDQCIFFERFDGSGLMNINIHELSDLEVVLTSLNYYYRFTNKEYRNILSDIREGSFNTNKKIMQILRRNFELVEVELNKEAKELVGA